MKKLLGVIVSTIMFSCTPCPSSQGGAIAVPNEKMCEDYRARFNRVINYLTSSDNPNLKSFEGPAVDWARWTVLVSERESWETPSGTVAGQTYCDLRIIAVGDNEPKKSALCHETIHAIQGCVSGAADLDGHAHWDEQKIWGVVDACQAAQ